MYDTTVNSRQQKLSFLEEVWQSGLRLRLLVLALCGLLALAVKFPLLLIAILFCGLAYSIYRIIKDPAGHTHHPQ